MRGALPCDPLDDVAYQDVAGALATAAWKARVHYAHVTLPFISYVYSITALGLKLRTLSQPLTPETTFYRCHLRFAIGIDLGRREVECPEALARGVFGVLGDAEHLDPPPHRQLLLFRHTPSTLRPVTRDVISSYWAKSSGKACSRR